MNVEEAMKEAKGWRPDDGYTDRQRTAVANAAPVLAEEVKRLREDVSSHAIALALEAERYRKTTKELAEALEALEALMGTVTAIDEQNRRCHEAGVYYEVDFPAARAVLRKHKELA